MKVISDWSFVPQTIAFIVGGYGYRLIAGKVDSKSLFNSIVDIRCQYVDNIVYGFVYNTNTLHATHSLQHHGIFPMEPVIPLSLLMPYNPLPTNPLQNLLSSKYASIGN